MNRKTFYYRDLKNNLAKNSFDLRGKKKIMSKYRIGEGEIFQGSADGSFVVYVMNGIATIIPLTGCFMGGVNPACPETPEVIRELNKKMGR